MFWLPSPCSRVKVFDVERGNDGDIYGGGVGLRSTQTHSSADYVASAPSFGPVSPSFHTQHAITELNSITNAKITLLNIKLKEAPAKKSLVTNRVRPI
jgi:hypothetical protein